MKACLVNPDSHVVVVEQLEDAADEFGIGEEGVTALPLPQHTLKPFQKREKREKMKKKESDPGPGKKELHILGRRG